MANKMPTVTTLRRWKRDALEAAFKHEGSRNPRDRKEILMSKNFAKVCDILVEEYPHIMNYDRITTENRELRNKLELRKVTGT